MDWLAKKEQLKLIGKKLSPTQKKLEKAKYRQSQWLGGQKHLR